MRSAPLPMRIEVDIADYFVSTGGDILLPEI